VTDGLEDFARRHPRLVRFLTGALVTWAAADLLAAVRLHVQAARLVGDLQREASESLGG
jgi:hypothetical protein